MPCNTDQILSALHEESPIITDIVYEKVHKSDKMILSKIPDKGVASRFENHSTVVYGEAFQAPVAYRQSDYAARLLVPGKMVGRSETGFNGIFDTNINDLDDNACHGQTVIDFSQGHRLRTPIPFDNSFTTPVKCVREFDRLSPAHIKGYFKAFRDQFARYGVDNFAENLTNMVIKYGEANASVVAANRFELTAGGFSAPPVFRMTIDFLQQYRRRIMQLKRGFGQDVSDNWMLEIEMPEQDWVDAVIEDNKQRNPTGTVYNTTLLTDEIGKLKGRNYAIYGGIKCYFNEEPIRGYFRISGTGAHRFVRVLPYVNEPDEVGGLVARYNTDYDNDTVIVDGISYPMVTMLLHIDRTSFERWGLEKPLKPIGDSNDSLNYNVKVLDGPYIDCNDHNDKFKLVGRHEFLFKATMPELSGAIAYRHGRRPGYVLAVTPRTDIAVGVTTAFEQVFRQQDIDACATAECAACDQVVDGQSLQCVPDAAVSVLTLAPAGANKVAIFGVATPVTLEVLRTGGAGFVTVAFATADGTANAGSDYTATSGTLTWEAGDYASKYIVIPFLAAATDTQTMTVTLSAPVGATIATGAATATLTILG